MLVTMPDADYEITYDELATLRYLADQNGIEEKIELSTSSLTNELNISNQTVSRRLRNLDDAGLIDRNRIHQGQSILITSKGLELLQRERRKYNQIFEPDNALIFSGVLTDGLGEGHYFISLDGYTNQFQEKLGYKPYPGTLNVELHPPSQKHLSELHNMGTPIQINGWDDGDTRYGPAVCYESAIHTDTDYYYSSHIIVPEKTRHGDSILEVIAPAKLRSILSISNGDEIDIKLG